MYGRKLCGREEALWNRVACCRVSVVIACNDCCTTGRLCEYVITADTRLQHVGMSSIGCDAQANSPRVTAKGRMQAEMVRVLGE